MRRAVCQQQLNFLFSFIFLYVHASIALLLYSMCISVYFVTSCVLCEYVSIVLLLTVFCYI